MRHFGKTGSVLAALLAACALPAPAAHAASVLHVLFVGDSFTHGRYDPVRQFASGFDSGPGAVTTPHVHDLLCASAASCSAAEAVAANDPDAVTYPAGVSTIADKLAYLVANPALQYAEQGPFGGVPGIVLSLAQHSGVPMDVSILAVSASTLGGKNLGGSKANLARMTNPAFDHVVLQEKSTNPLPPTVTVNGVSVATKGNPAAFSAGVSLIVNAIDAADAAAGRAPIPVTLVAVPPIASQGFVSDDPDKYLFGTSFGPPGSPAAPYVGAPDPMGQMTADLSAANDAVADAWNAAHPAGSASPLDVAHVGDAWLQAMRLRIAQGNPYLAHEPVFSVDLWDSDVPDACCVVPIGYHPSTAGAYLDALVLFGQITGRDLTTLDPLEPTARALGLPLRTAIALRAVAAWTLAHGRPRSFPLPLRH